MNDDKRSSALTASVTKALLPPSDTTDTIAQLNKSIERPWEEDLSMADLVAIRKRIVALEAENRKLREAAKDEPSEAELLAAMDAFYESRGAWDGQGNLTEWRKRSMRTALIAAHKARER